MPQKKIIREPVEKLSSETIVEITESSSDEEGDDTAPMIKPVKKERTAAQIASTKKMIESRRRNKLAKQQKIADSLDVTTHPAKSVAVEDDDIKFARQMNAYNMSQNKPKTAPVKKPRKPRATKAEVAARKAERVVNETPAPPPPLTRAKPDMLFV